MNLANTSSEMPVESYPTLNTAIRSFRRPWLAVRVERLRTRMSAILSESHTHAAGAGASGATAAALGLEEIEIVEMTATAPALLHPPVASALDPPVAPSVRHPPLARLPVPGSSEPKETAAVAPGAREPGRLRPLLPRHCSRQHLSRRPSRLSRSRRRFAGSSSAQMGGGNGYILAARAR